MTYTEIAAEYDKALEEYKRIKIIQNELDRQLERSEFILKEIRAYLEDPTSYKMKISL